MTPALRLPYKHLHVAWMVSVWSPESASNSCLRGIRFQLTLSEPCVLLKWTFPPSFFLPFPSPAVLRHHWNTRHRWKWPYGYISSSQKVASTTRYQVICSIKVAIRFGLVFFLFSLLMTSIYNVYPGPVFCGALLNTHTDAEPRVFRLFSSFKFARLCANGETDRVTALRIPCAWSRTCVVISHTVNWFQTPANRA